MGAARSLLIPLDAPGDCGEQIVGGKAHKLAQLARAGFRVPPGFCLTTWAYETFVSGTPIRAAIRMELGRKPMEEMRWEEIWDTALRIRSLFLAQPLPAPIRRSLADGMSVFAGATRLAVRSSAVGEDSDGGSFAGLHESIIGVSGERAVEDAVRLVWASLWSDAALLYRQELGLDPARSRMAVLVQEMVDADRSGVAFARDPRDVRKDQAIIESVPGPCSLLVDGLVDPDRWELDRGTRGIITWLPGERADSGDTGPLLETADLAQILETLLSIEELFCWSPDMEWTGRREAFTVLQARPITTAARADDEQRSWYLTLRPGDAQLRELRRRVAEQLIPALEAEGQALADEELDLLDERQLADAIEKRGACVAKWKQIYWDDFIPFAHGVRRLATYYNDAVQPEDPYEFIGLLRDQPLLAAQRNRAIAEVAAQLASNVELRTNLTALLARDAGQLRWPRIREELVRTAAGAVPFVDGFDTLRTRFFDIAYDHERVQEQTEPLLRNIVELSHSVQLDARDESPDSDRTATLEQRLLRAVGPDRQAEAMDVIDTGRVSWKLRDDDNLLVARLDSQLLRALGAAAERLRGSGRLTGEGRLDESFVQPLIRALRDPSAPPITLRAAQEPQTRQASRPEGETPRQLVGQPAAPGVGTGSVRCVRGGADLGKFRRGEVLVCDAIQPTMTHLVPLASAIVERRGGMLIHGAIIARELGIPCVNGVRKAADILSDGDLVTVDGHLGIVAVGAADFELEFRNSASPSP